MVRNPEIQPTIPTVELICHCSARHAPPLCPHSSRRTRLQRRSAQTRNPLAVLRKAPMDSTPAPTVLLPLQLDRLFSRSRISCSPHSRRPLPLGVTGGYQQLLFGDTAAPANG